jgi:REP element-mobilizing transposase RayT
VASAWPSIVEVLVLSTCPLIRCLSQAPLQCQTSSVPNRPRRLEYVFESYDPPLYFVTFNVHQRRRLLANESVHTAFLEFARNGAKQDIAIGRYVIMPDHLHLFARGCSYDTLLSQWMRLLKRSFQPQSRNRGHIGSMVFSTMSFETGKVIPRNGTTFGKIRSVRVWLQSQMIGPGRARSSGSKSKKL